MSWGGRVAEASWHSTYRRPLAKNGRATLCFCSALALEMLSIVNRIERTDYVFTTTGVRPVWVRDSARMKERTESFCRRTAQRSSRGGSTT